MTNVIVERAFRRHFGWKPGYEPEPSPEQAEEYLAAKKGGAHEGSSDRLEDSAATDRADPDAE